MGVREPRGARGIRRQTTERRHDPARKTGVSAGAAGGLAERPGRFLIRPKAFCGNSLRPFWATQGAANHRCKALPLDRGIAGGMIQLIPTLLARCPGRVPPETGRGNPWRYFWIITDFEVALGPRSPHRPQRREVPEVRNRRVPERESPLGVNSTGYRTETAVLSPTEWGENHPLCVEEILP